MREYTMSDVAGLLDVKTHVIRYWQQEIPFLSSKKTLTGRHLFTDRDVQLLFRLKHLLYEKRFTMEGARNRLWEEMNSPDIEYKARIS